ncbi:MAG: zinc-dependent metalloprotease [Wenzhouxiangella sp.]|nr:zinc-dependent metalloprotease [Wenzhouxiangella sp.]
MPSSDPSRPFSIASLVLLLLVASAAQAERALLDAAALTTVDRNADEILIRGLRLSDERHVDLLLLQVDPIARDASLRRPGAELLPLRSERRFYSGAIVGEGHRSQASLSVGADGLIRGVLSERSGHWVLQSDASQLQARSVSDQAAARSAEHDHFQCGVDSAIQQQSIQARLADELARPELTQPRQDSGERYRVRLAYDTTARFVNQFDDPQDVIDFLGDLTNFISTLYVNDLNTEIVISSITLRDDDEPWDLSGDLLAQFRSYWNNAANSVDQTRTIAHLVDAGPQSGVAYVGALCVNNFDYGLSQGLGTEFNPDANPQNWAFFVVAHEIGHNFGSQHTHCYQPGVDECFGEEANCFSGTPSLPGPTGQGSGTIMSYCHLRPGGLSNLAISLGRNHPFGNNPDRVPTTMRAHVLQRAAVNNPRCPQPVVTDIFVDRFELH